MVRWLLAPSLVGTRLMLLTLAAAMTAGVAAPARAQGNRVQVVADLERLIATGRPAHVDHDDGEQLQRDLHALLSAPDPEISRLARRAAAPIVTFISHPIAAPSGPPYVGIETRRVLDAPAPEGYVARIAVSIDGGPWIPFCEIGPSSACGRNAQQLPPAATTPGFHHLRFQAVVRHEDGQVETRPLPPVAYGIMGVARGTAERRDPALFVRAAATTPARSIDARLPDVPLTDWLVSLHAPGSSLEAARWESQWCGLGTRAHSLELDTQAICMAGQLQVAETKMNAEVRFRVGRLEWTDGLPRWVAEDPVLDAILIRGRRTAWLSALAQLPVVLRSSEDAWPRAHLSVDPVDIEYTILASNEGAGTVLVRSTLRNTGEAHAYGVVVQLMAIASLAEGPMWRRRRVVDVPARGSASIAERISYPAGYGAFVVQVLFTGDGGPFSDRPGEDDGWSAAAFRVLNPRAAPAGYVTLVGQMLCANQCRGF